jgi:Rad3-related DNA helicase
MAKVTMRLPGVTARKLALKDLEQRLDVNESLESLIETMQRFEAQFGMSTVQFYSRFAAGKLRDSRDFIKWAGAFDDYYYLLRTHFRHRDEAA